MIFALITGVFLSGVVFGVGAVIYWIERHNLTVSQRD